MKQVEFEEIPCICGANGTVVVGEKDGLIVGNCVACGILRTPFTFKNYSELYTEGDRYHVERAGQIPYRERFDHDREVAKSRLAKFEHFVAPRWLDVGCANGGFLVEVKSHFERVRVEGLELNTKMAEWASRAADCLVHTSWDSVEGLFDVISFHDVLEHIPDPLATLSNIRKRLVGTGTVIIDVPDGGYEPFIADPMASRHMKPLEHLWFFRETDLRKMLARTGFVVHAVDRPISGKLVIYARVAV